MWCALADDGRSKKAHVLESRTPRQFPTALIENDVIAPFRAKTVKGVGNTLARLADLRSDPQYTSVIAAPRRPVCVRRHDPSECVCVRIVCVVCLSFFFVPRHLVLRIMLREAQSSVDRCRCAERSELLYPLRFSVVAARADGGTFCSLALQRNEARAQREHSVCNLFGEPVLME